MLQAIVKKGKVFAEQVPTPIASKGSVLIKVKYSCISAGTESSGVKESGKSLIKRAMEQPEQVKQVWEFFRSNGLSKTIQRVKGQVDSGKQTGYSISGQIIAIGQGVTDHKIGDHVAAAGAGIANHAEFVDVPINLVMKMPKNLGFEEASTVTLGGIAMQGVRRCDLKLGEFAVVQGAGILGLLAQQMFQASGVRTIVIDLDEKRLELAKSFGASLMLNPKKDDIVKEVNLYTGGKGADAILFAAATSSSEPLSDSFKMCKKKGKVVLMGVSGMEINRADIYAKEIDFLISTSYGPGRYDRNYEEKGLDYPYAYVRWTENRNMEEYLRLVDEGHIDVQAMISEIYPIEDVDKAFENLKPQAGQEVPLISLLTYPERPEIDNHSENNGKTVITRNNYQKKSGDVIQVALIGAGGFAKGMHLPNLKSLSHQFQLRAVMNRTGFNAKAVAEQYNAQYATTDYQEVLRDSEVDLVLITTRHDSHANYVLQALKAGKNVFVEKPLCISEEELQEIETFYETKGEKPLLMVGFNRRFSKYATEIKRHTSKRINPLLMRYRMNAGYIPLDHWVHESGGRIIGEGCHILDLMRYFTESPIQQIQSIQLSPKNDHYSSTDNTSIQIKYQDGSIAIIDYFANGSKSLMKEQLEVHFDGKSIIMEDFKKLIGYGIKVNNLESKISQKGQLEELKVLYHSLTETNQPWPISLEEMIETTRASFVV